MGGLSPTFVSQIGGPALGKWAPIVSSFENQWALFPGEPKDSKKLRFCFKMSCAQSHSKAQPRGSSLKSSWVICKGDSLTVSGKGRDMLRLSSGMEVLVDAFFPPPSYPGAGGHHFWHSPSTTGTTHPTPVFHCRLTLPNLPGQRSPKRLSALPHSAGSLSQYRYPSQEASMMMGQPPHTSAPATVLIISHSYIARGLPHPPMHLQLWQPT